MGKTIKWLTKSSPARTKYKRELARERRREVRVITDEIYGVSGQTRNVHNDNELYGIHYTTYARAILRDMIRKETVLYTDTKYTCMLTRDMHALALRQLTAIEVLYFGDMIW